VKDVGAVRAIRTVPVALDGRNRGFVVTQELELPDGTRLPEGSNATTAVKVEIARR
jgi:hypothetical protein